MGLRISLIFIIGVNLDPAVQKILADAIILASKHKITIVFEPRAVTRGMRSTGYFDSSTRKLVMATKSDPKVWGPLISHEVCHMEQYLENAPAWTQCYYKGRDAAEIVFAWVDKKEKFHRKTLKQCFYKTVLVEADCEVRSSTKLAAYGYKEIDDYIKRANSYLCFYLYVYDHQCWYKPDRRPYEIEEIVEAMPTEILYSDCKSFDEMYQIYKDNFKHIFEKNVTP